MRKILTFIVLLTALLPVRAQINTDQMLAVGRNSLYFEDYVLAIQYFNQVIAIKPYTAEAYFLRALAKYNLDDYAGAEADATSALDIHPFLPDAWEIRAVSRQSMGNDAGAVADYEQALRLLPHNKQMMFNKALAEEQAGWPERADSTYSQLLAVYPGYDNAYVGRAQLRLNQSDTIAARNDVERALELNPKSAHALMMHAALVEHSDPAAALADVDAVVRLMPLRVGPRINRSVLRYRLNDLRGAMEDLNYAVEMEPMNLTALYNRSLLSAELGDLDRAEADLDRIISINPSDFRALYNRAVIYAEKRNIDAAMADIDRVLRTYPDLFAAYSLRGYINELAGNVRQSKNDYQHARTLAMSTVEHTEDADVHNIESAEAVTGRFHTLLSLETSEVTDGNRQRFNNSSIRGRVQDNTGSIEMQPIFTLSYYTAYDAGDEGLITNTLYVKDVADINAAHTLNHVLFMTNRIPAITRESDARTHMEGLKRPGNRAIDHFSRAMDHITLHDYEAAVTDLDKAVTLMPDFALAYFMRAVARYRIQEAQQGTVSVVTDDMAEQLAAQRTRMSLDMIMSDLNRAAELSPTLAAAHFNRGTILLQMNDFDGAIKAFDRAIAINPDFGAAYFNRGYARFSLGDRDGATTDISRAGQLGIHAGYSLLKRMTR